jgi:hypothetical protein
MQLIAELLKHTYHCMYVEASKEKGNNRMNVNCLLSFQNLQCSLRKSCMIHLFIDIFSVTNIVRNLVRRYSQIDWPTTSKELHYPVLMGHVSAARVCAWLNSAFKQMVHGATCWIVMLMQKQCSLSRNKHSSANFITYGTRLQRLITY